MNHTTKNDLYAGQMNNRQLLEDLVSLESLLSELEANQRGKLYIYIYTHYYDNIGHKIGAYTIINITTTTTNNNNTRTTCCE